MTWRTGGADPADFENDEISNILGLSGIRGVVVFPTVVPYFQNSEKFWIRRRFRLWGPCRKPMEGPVGKIDANSGPAGRPQTQRRPNFVSLAEARAWRQNPDPSHSSVIIPKPVWLVYFWDRGASENGPGSAPPKCLVVHFRFTVIRASPWAFSRPGF